MTSRPEDEQATIQKVTPVRPESVVYELVVIEGPDAGARFRFDATQPSRLLVGQSPACGARLTDRRASRRHVALDLSPEGLRLTDLGSSNGTFVGALRVTDVFLSGGEVLRMGDSVLRVDVVAQRSPAPLSSSTSFGSLVGASTPMRRLYPLCERLARSDVPVIVEGETGTGKEVLARSLHDTGARSAGPFVVFDCTAVPASLVESALFGHEKGSFTGASAARRGVFEQAHGGTLFIDEIGDLEPSLQPKLLRALERSEVQRVGAERWLKVDVRVIAATRRDLDREVAAGRFRDDLFFRLAVARIELPPLRRRHGDVGLLARHFWKKLGGEGKAMPQAAFQRFEDYAWPGNVRELHNAVARQLALGELAGDEPPLRSSASPPDAPPPPAPASTDAIDEVLALDLPLSQSRDQLIDTFERRYVERMVAKHGGNVTRAAAAAGVAARYFQLLRARQAKT